MKYICVFALFLFACQQKHHADKVVIGKTWTGSENSPWSEGFAVVGDSIVFVGTASELQNWITNETKVIKLEGSQIVVPGFIDTHTHFIEGGLALASVQLRDAKSKAEF